MPAPNTILLASLPLPQPQVQLPTIPITPMLDLYYKELKAEIDVQAILITTLSGKDEDSSETTKHLQPLANEVYFKVLPEKYKCPTFKKFDRDRNPWDHIIIFKIECRQITTHGRLKLQQFPTSLSGNTLR